MRPAYTFSRKKNFKTGFYGTIKRYPKISFIIGKNFLNCRVRGPDFSKISFIILDKMERIDKIYEKLSYPLT